MFALVIVIGLLVDDAIVVVENVERIMSEEGLSPREATIKSMGQITSALVGIATVLTAVFVPMAFFGGSTGVIYRQFSITIVSAMILSVLVAMILTPALCATLLKPVPKGHSPGEYGWFKGFFGWFNKVFDRSRGKYEGLVGRSFGKPVRYLVIYGAIVAVMVVLFVRLPTAFLPDEDQGFIICQVQLPAGATQERTLKVIEQLEQHFLEKEKKTVDSLITVAGFSFAGRGQNMGLAFVKLKDWKLRKTPGPEGAGRRRPGHGGVLQDQGRYGLRLCAAGGDRTGDGQRLRLSAAGSRRAGTRQADGGAQPAPGHGDEEPEADGGPSQRPGRHAAVQARHRRRARRRPGCIGHRHQQRALHRLGERLRQRLHPERPGEEGLSPVRCEVPDAAGGYRQMVCPQQQGRDGPLLRLRHPPLGVRLAAAGALQRHSLHGDHGAGGAGGQYR